MLETKTTTQNNAPKSWAVILRKNALTASLLVVIVLLFISKDFKAQFIRMAIRTGITGSPRIEAGAPFTSEQSIGYAKFKDVNGKVFTLSDLEGKVVFINFWAIWCAPCRAEIKGIAELKKQFAQDTSVVFLMVDADRKLVASARFLKRKDGDLFLNVPNESLPTSLVELLGPVPAELYSRSIPASFILDRNGRVVMRFFGAADYSHPAFLDAFRKFVDK